MSTFMFSSDEREKIQGLLAEKPSGDVRRLDA